MISAAIRRHDTSEEKGGDDAEGSDDEGVESRSTWMETRSDGDVMQRARDAYPVPLGLLFSRFWERTGHGRHYFLSKRRTLVVGARCRRGRCEVPDRERGIGPTNRSGQRRGYDEQSWANHGWRKIPIPHRKMWTLIPNPTSLISLTFGTSSTQRIHSKNCTAVLVKTPAFDSR